MEKTKAAPVKEPLKLLKNWNTLNAQLMRLTEEQVSALLEHEKKNDNRLTFTLRLHARLNKMRATRERKALAQG